MENKWVGKHGLVIHGDCHEVSVVDLVATTIGDDQCLGVFDPPYGDIVKEKWDTNWSPSQALNVFLDYDCIFKPGDSMYMWGGIGRYRNRCLFQSILSIEQNTCWQMRNMLTWGKKRAYGKSNDYLFTREELCWFVKGESCSAEAKPSKFNIPLLDQKRGYAGYNEKYPAKSEYLRRTNVWSDINELFRGKKHPTEKPTAVFRIPIEVSSDEGDWVLDMFAGSGTAGVAAMELDRRYILVEKDPVHFETIINRLKEAGETQHDAKITTRKKTAPPNATHMP